jgi:hypothetical protein
MGIKRKIYIFVRQEVKALAEKKGDGCFCLIL